MRARLTAAAMILGLVGTGCSSPGYPPAAPSPPRSGITDSPVPVPPPGPSRAVVAISDVSITPVATPNNGSYKFGYLVRFAVTETGGLSGATIQNVETAVDGGDRFSTGSGCWRDTFRVAPGGTLHAFDQQADDLGYCAPDAASRGPASRFSIVVAFTDDDGRSGTAAATGSVRE